jgi:hypothetical protein
VHSLDLPGDLMVKALSLAIISITSAERLSHFLAFHIPLLAFEALFAGCILHYLIVSHTVLSANARSLRASSRHTVHYLKGIH